MSDKKCKNCGGIVDFDKTTGLGTCQYCGTKQTLLQEEMNNIQKTKAHKNFARKSIIIRILLIIIIVVIYIIYMVNR